MMSQSKFVVASPGLESALPSRPNERIEYACAATAALKSWSELYTRSLPQPSFGGSDLMYVGERMVVIVSWLRVIGGSTMTPAALYLLTSVARASHAVAIVRMSAMVRFCLARCMAVSRFGMAIAARMPMIATTISSSMRVKPFWVLLILVMILFS